jgi:outer membrane protein assembly factor BamB
VRCHRQADGEEVWKFKSASGGLESKGRGGFWASPVVVNNRVYIGSDDGIMYCLSSDKGEKVWQYKARSAIWGTAPVVDGRVVFGDKAGWMHMLSADTGESIWELKIGDNVNSTPAVLNGRIYIGAFNGKLYCLGSKENMRVTVGG